MMPEDDLRDWEPLDEASLCLLPPAAPTLTLVPEPHPLKHGGRGERGAGRLLCTTQPVERLGMEAAPGAQPGDDLYAAATQAGKDPWGKGVPWCFKSLGKEVDAAATEARLVVMLKALGVQDADIVQHQGSCQALWEAVRAHPDRNTLLVNPDGKRRRPTLKSDLLVGWPAERGQCRPVLAWDENDHCWGTWTQEEKAKRKLREEEKRSKRQRVDAVPPPPSVAPPGVAQISAEDAKRQADEAAAAAERRTLLLLHNPIALLQETPHNKRSTKLCLAAVRQEWWAIKDVPDEKKTEQVCLEAVRQARDKRPGDEGENLWEVGTVLKHIPDEKKTEAVCFEAIRESGFALGLIPYEKKTEAMCLEAVRRNGLALQYVPDDKKTEQLCLEAIRGLGNGALEFVLTHVPGIEMTELVCLEAVRHDGRACRRIPMTNSLWDEHGRAKHAPAHAVHDAITLAAASKDYTDIFKNPLLGCYEGLMFR